jgi:transcriptional regulator of acetoin/glycerol metabolism
VGAWDEVLAGAAPTMAPRRVVAASWQRSLAAQVDPEHGAPSLVYEHAEVAQVRAGHPLTGVLPLLRDTLVTIADEAMHMMIVTDAQGRILWREGRRDVLRRGERVGLVEGTLWSEESIGTNAMGTALASGGAVQIHAAEHLVRTYHRWTCAAAPIHDPETGAVIGVVDVTGPERTFHPTTLALVVAAARLAEGYLRTQLAVRDERLLSRNLPHLVGLRDEPGALLSPSGRVLAAQPSGWLPARVDLPAAGDRVRAAGPGRRGPAGAAGRGLAPAAAALAQPAETGAHAGVPGCHPADGAPRRAAGAAVAAARRAAHLARAAPRGPHRRRAGCRAAR